MTVGVTELATRPRRGTRLLTLLCALTFPFVVWSRAGHADDSTSVPAPPVLIDTHEEREVHLRVQGLPAMSSLGDKVAFVASRGEYNDSGWYELRIASARQAQTRWPLETYDNEPQTAAEIQTIREATRRAQARLESGHFVPLSKGVHHDLEGDSYEQRISVGPWQVQYRPTSRTVRVLNQRGKVVFARRVGMRRQGSCCSPDVSQSTQCLVGYTHLEVWGNEKVVLAQGHNIDGPDGCEVDEQYLVIWPKAGKADVSNN
jgi:hypothetical protein